MNLALPLQLRRVGVVANCLRRPLILCMGLATAAACTAPSQNGVPAARSAEPSDANDSTTAVASRTPGPLLTAEQATATVAELPDHVYEVDTRPWPEQGDLLEPVGDHPEFGVEVAGLASGSYLLLADRDTRLASAYSLDTGVTEELLWPDSADSRPVQFVLDHGISLLGSREPAGYWRLYDLRERTSWAIGPTCRGAWNDWLSPDGDWIGTVCSDDLQLEGTTYDHVVIQFLSTRTGIGARFAIPSIVSERDRPDLAWIDDGSALISTVLVRGELRACVLTIEQATMYCPPLGLGAAAAPPGNIAPADGWVPFERSEFLTETKLVPPDCFKVESACEGILQLSESSSNIAIPTSDPEIVWWIELLGPDPTTEVGLIELGSGEFRQLASLGGDYSSRAICPDGSCMFIFQYDSEINWRLNLDGSLQVLPFPGDVILGSFRIP